MTESLYSIGFKSKAPFCVSFAINLSLKLKYQELKRMKTISFKQLSKGGKTKTLLYQKASYNCCFLSISPLLKSIGLKNQANDSQSSDAFVTLN